MAPNMGSVNVTAMTQEIRKHRSLTGSQASPALRSLQMSPCLVLTYIMLFPFHRVKFRPKEETIWQRQGAGISVLFSTYHIRFRPWMILEKDLLPS